MGYKIDTELIIMTIENQRCIWDASCEEYKNRDIKNKAYKDVAAVVVQDFDKITEKEQSEAIQLVQKRWKTSRDAYVRDRAKLKKLKSGDAAKMVKKYIYFDNLRFLDKTMDLNTTETNLTCDQNNETCAQDNLEVSSVLSQSEDDEETETSGRQSSQNFTRRKRKKKDTVDDKLIQFLKDSENSDRDDHRAFLVSLLPTLRTFNETQTLLFRSEVLRIMMGLKNIAPHPYFPSASNQSVPYSNPPSSPSSSVTNVFSTTPLISPNSTYSNPPYSSSLASGNTQSSSVNNATSRPTLLQLCGTQFDEPQPQDYIVSAIVHENLPL